MNDSQAKPSAVLAEGRKIDREHWRKVFEQAKDDGILSEAIDLIRHLHDCVVDGTPINPRYESSLAQWLNVHDLLLDHVDEFVQVVTSSNVKSFGPSNEQGS